MSADEECETAGTSSMMESTMMEGEAYYQPETTVAWTEKANGSDQLCRICASPNEYLIPIFSGEGVEHQLGMKIERHLPIQVVKQDKLPLHVCYQCASTLIAWHDLHMGCLEAEKKLRQMFPECEEEVEHDSDDDDKADNFYSEPMESEMTEDPLEPSTSAASKPNRPTRSPRKKTVTKAKLKLNKSSNLLEPKEEQTDPDPASERQEESLPLKKKKSRSTVGRKNRAKHRCKQDKSEELLPADDGEPNAFPCELCTKSFNTSAILRAHYQLHSLLDTKKTYGRNQVFLIPKDASGVPSTASSHRIYTCDECDLCFYQTDELYDHKEIVHSSTDEPSGAARCRECNVRLENREEFNAHYVSLHFKSGELVDSYECAEPGCDKRYEKKQGLRQHVRKVHKRDKNLRYPCEVCGKLFTQSYTLSSHMSVHTGALNYACDVCGKLFRVLSNLKVHLLTHTDLKPVVCSVCEKHFRKKAHLTTHMRIHTGEKPFECDICGRRFNQSVLRNKHRVNVHNVLQCGTSHNAYAHPHGLESVHLRAEVQPEHSALQT